jgi:DNA-binding response OmpR family regulator
VISAGMDDYITKPYDEDILISDLPKHTVNKDIASRIQEIFSKIFDR